MMRTRIFKSLTSCMSLGKLHPLWALICSSVKLGCQSPLAPPWDWVKCHLQESTDRRRDLGREESWGQMERGASVPKGLWRDLSTSCRLQVAVTI